MILLFKSSRTLDQVESSSPITKIKDSNMIAAKALSLFFSARVAGLIAYFKLYFDPNTVNVKEVFPPTEP